MSLDYDTRDTFPGQDALGLLMAIQVIATSCYC